MNHSTNPSALKPIIIIIIIISGAPRAREARAWAEPNS